jgi:AraC-like DNA-binding protein
MATSRLSNIVDQIHLRLFAAAVIQIESGDWNTQNVCDPFWRFYLNERDGASLELKDRSVPLRAGALYLVPEGVHFSCANSLAVRHFFIHFDFLGVPRPILQQLFAAPLEIDKASDLAREANLLRDGLETIDDFSISLQCRAKALLFGCLGHIFQLSERLNLAQYPHLSAHHAPILPALEWIENHLDEKMSNEMLARLCHWSEDHFARRFSECVGQSPGSYIRSRRIAVASQQLLFSSKSIEQIAQESGFANRFHFSRAFARDKNSSPAAYRKTTRV